MFKKSKKTQKKTKKKRAEKIRANFLNMLIKILNWISEKIKTDFSFEEALRQV